MRTREDQEARQRAACRHYFGSGGGSKCKAGVEFYSFNDGKMEGSALKLPCFGPSGFDERSTPGTCEKYSPYTDEEIEQRDAEHREAMLRIGKIRNAIVTALGGPWTRQNPKGGAGTIPCPCCDGTVHYSRASVNGHIHAQCTTKGCARWME